jgi:hypothetical protein
MSSTNPSRLPIKPETRERAIELMTREIEPMGRNAIARELGISGPTVGNIAREIGHVFDWAATEAATAARRVQADKIRENIANLMLLEAHNALQRLHEPAVMVHFEPGRTRTDYDEEGRIRSTVTEPGEFREHVLDEPTYSDQRNLMTIAGIAVTKAAEVSRPQPGQGAEQGVAVLTRFAEGLEIVAAKLRADGVDPTAIPEG